MRDLIVDMTTLRDKDIPKLVFERVHARFGKQVVSEIDKHHPVGSNWMTFDIQDDEQSTDVKAIQYRIRVADMDLVTVICRAELVEKEIYI